MTLSEKEALIDAWPHPWPEVMEIARNERDARLKTSDYPETERPAIEKQYEEELDRMLGSSPPATEHRYGKYGFSVTARMDPTTKMWTAIASIDRSWNNRATVSVLNVGSDGLQRSFSSKEDACAAAVESAKKRIDVPGT